MGDERHVTPRVAIITAGFRMGLVDQTFQTATHSYLKLTSNSLFVK